MSCQRKFFSTFFLILCVIILCKTATGATINPANGSSFVYSTTSVTLSGSPSSGAFTCDVPAAMGPTSAGIAIFNPSVAGVGAHVIHYTKAGTFDETITVFVLPVLTFSPTVTSFCQEGSPYGIDGYTGTPAGGTFTFTGGYIPAGSSTFTPALAGAGAHTITANYTLNGVTAKATAIFNVQPTPTIDIVNLLDKQCQTKTDYLIKAQNTVTHAFINGGTFTGRGITDNGNGSATFSPNTAGLGRCTGNPHTTDDYANQESRRIVTLY
jgi:hypothetical protein